MSLPTPDYSVLVVLRYFLTTEYSNYSQVAKIAYGVDVLPYGVMVVSNYYGTRF